MDIHLVIPMPLGPIDNMPGMDASKPSLDSISRTGTAVLANEHTEQGPGCQHTVSLGNVVLVTELCEPQDICTICGFHVGGVIQADGHKDKIWEAWG